MGSFVVLGTGMTKKKLQVGVIVSTSGSYGTVGKTIKNGVCIAIEELNKSLTNIELEVRFANPAGDNSKYVDAAQEMLESGIRHIIGCYTSSSRKQILPLLERYDAILWYPAHYEGFESSDNVIYTGTTTNQHLHPMVDYMHTNHGGSAYCIGSDYIWAWESNRVFKDEFIGRGGYVLGEEYVPIDCVQIDSSIERILECKPNFILSNLIGASSYHFFRRFRQLCLERGIDQIKEMPIVSCTLSEADLVEVGPDACDGHLSSSVYFASVVSNENQKFVSIYRDRYPSECVPTVEAEAAYIATHFLAVSLNVCSANNKKYTICDLKKIALSCQFNAPQGLVKLDPITFHTYLTPRIGISVSDGTFKILAEASEPLRPDPYLVNASAELMLHIDDAIVSRL